MAIKPETHAYWYAQQLQWETNILAVYRSATADAITEGKRWYPYAANELAILAATSGLQMHPNTIAAVCAVLSPRITWQSNLEGVRRILAAKRQGNRLRPKVAGTRKNVDKAWSIANGDLSIVEGVTGPKVSRFYANISGDLTRVTCDVWAARAAGIEDAHHTHLDRYRYTYLERAYQAVAKEVGFEPAELQAICWIVVRGKGE